MMFLLYWAFVSSGLAAGFLLQDAGNNQSLGNPQTQTDMTVLYLLGLIVDEKNSRHQLESIVTLMGNKIDQLEKEFAQKETDMDNKLKQSNAKLSQLEQYHTEVSRELEKEKNNRQYLEQQVIVLQTRFGNVTEEFENIKNELVAIGQNSANVTSIDRRLTNLTGCCVASQNEITKVQRNISDILDKVLITDKIDRNMTKHIYALEKQLKNLTDVTRTQLNNTNAEVQTLMKNVTLFNYGERFVGFSVIKPNATLGWTLGFERIIFNTGYGYNQSTGIFTCKVPGAYIFSVTVIKTSSAGECSCQLHVNGQYIIRVFANDGNSSGFSSASSSIVYKLHKGDTVYLAACSDLSAFYSHDTAFSGALIAPSDS